MKETYSQYSKIVFDVGVEMGIVLRTSSVKSSSDKDTRQIAQLVAVTCEDLLMRFPWSVSLGTDPWVMMESGEYTHELNNDTDIPLMDSQTIRFGAEWRYMAAKGLSYGELFRAYEVRISKAAFTYNGDNVVNLNVAAAT